MSWPKNPKLEKPDLFGNLSPHEMLYEFDLARIFTYRDTLGGLFLVYTADFIEEENILCHLVVPSCSKTIKALKEGELSVREALTSGPPYWIVDLDVRDEYVLRAYRITLSELPSDALPSKNIPLYSNLRRS